MTARVGLLLSMWLVGCGQSPRGDVIVDVRTDLVFGVEVDGLRATLLRPERGDPPVVTELTAADDLLAGVRAGRFEDVGGEVRIRIEATLQGETVVGRDVALRPSGLSAVTVPLTRDCVGVVCDDPEASACISGSCVPDDCTEETGDACPGRCASDDECASSAACNTGRCISGSCVLADGCGETAWCDPESGCQTRPDAEAVFSVVEGLTLNVVAGASGEPTAQPEIGGWRFLYDPAGAFGRYGPLSGGALDTTRYVPLELGYGDGSFGWATSGGIAPGRRGVIFLIDYETGESPALGVAGDALYAGPENDHQVVVEWTATQGGRVEVRADIGVRTDDPRADVEWHVLFAAPGADEATDAARVYVSGDGDPDVNDQPTVLGTRAAPVELTASAILAPGARVYLYGRIGDDDAFDGSYLRAAFTMTAAPPDP